MKEQTIGCHLAQPLFTMHYTTKQLHGNTVAKDAGTMVYKKLSLWAEVENESV